MHVYLGSFGWVLAFERKGSVKIVRRRCQCMVAYRLLAVSLPQSCRDLQQLMTAGPPDECQLRVEVEVRSKIIQYH